MTDIRDNQRRAIKGRYGVMPALDIENFDDVLRLVESTTLIEGIIGYKLGLTAVLRIGLFEAIRRVRGITPLPIIYDHQKAGLDVPSMAQKLTNLVADAGADALILFPVAGPTAVAKFVESSIASGLTPLVGGELAVDDYTVSGGGFIGDNALVRIIELAASHSATNFIVPAHSSDRVRVLAEHARSVANDPALFLPGIGDLGGSIPKAFDAAGHIRAYAIVGRAIYNAQNPAEAARRLAGEALAFAV
jgi:orotidine-5'-phosphate decarboxylase